MQIDTARLREEAEKTLATAKTIYHETIRYIEGVERIASNAHSKDATQSLPFVYPNRPGHKVMHATTRIRPWQGVRHAIKESLAETPSGVTVRDVAAFIVRVYPGHTTENKAISLSLSRMSKITKVLKVVNPAAGNVPATYALADSKKDEQAEQEDQD
jgi:hypothetical protein